MLLRELHGLEDLGRIGRTAEVFFVPASKYCNGWQQENLVDEVKPSTGHSPGPNFEMTADQGENISFSSISVSCVSTGTGGGSPDADHEDGEERIARPRNISSQQLASSGTDNERLGMERVARPRDINNNANVATVVDISEEREVPAQPRDINGSSALGPKGTCKKPCSM